MSAASVSREVPRFDIAPRLPRDLQLMATIDVSTAPARAGAVVRDHPPGADSSRADPSPVPPGRAALGGRALLAALAMSLLLAGCATPHATQSDAAPAATSTTGKAAGKRKGPGPVIAHEREPRPVPNQRRRVGEATYYAPYFEGRLTASGEPYDGRAMTAAHKTLPFGTRVKVTHLSTGDSAIVRINDRGPFVPGRIIDLSQRAAEKLGLIDDGTADVQLQVLEQ